MRAAAKRWVFAAALLAALATLAQLPLSTADASPRLDEAEPLPVCVQWARIAAAEAGVPERLLLAIAKVETGRSGSVAGAQHEPWPWTVNAGGEGRWFTTRAQAVAFIDAQIANGTPQIDVGCFQLNVKWHARAFASADQMIEPARNARYAARFLKHLYTEFGDWTRAAAAYHSRTPALGRAYVVRLHAALQSLSAPAERNTASTNSAADPLIRAFASANPAPPLETPVPPAQSGPRQPGGVSLGALTHAAAPLGAR